MVKNRLKQARTAAGLSQQELARHVGVSRSIYADYERGVYYPGDANRARLCAALGVQERSLWPEGGARHMPASFVLFSGRGRYPTQESLRQQVGITLGQRMERKLSLDGMGVQNIPCGVVEITPRWFRVRWERSGVMECFGYQAFLEDKELRRIGE